MLVKIEYYKTVLIGNSSKKRIKCTIFKENAEDRRILDMYQIFDNYAI